MDGLEATSCRHPPLHVRRQPSNIDALIVWIHFRNYSKSADFDGCRTSTTHSFDRDAVALANLVSARRLRRLVSIAVSQEPVAAPDECFKLIVAPTPHRADDTVIHHLCGLSHRSYLLTHVVA